ncbi:MAG: peptide-binding protein [Lentisphaeria bacterium]|nr:peptide-binding protein [Lentisphaeria bacterium]
MSGGIYLKFILTVLTLAVIVFGYLGVSAVDRLHRVNVKLLEKLEKGVPASPAAPRTPTEKAAAPERVSNIANRRFYAPDAIPGGRIVHAVEAEPPNLNPIICNEAAASRFYGLCSASLAERDLEKPEEFQPLLAESWRISKDHKVIHIKLRRGVMWQRYTDPFTGKSVPPREVTAHDFRFFLDVIRDPDVNCAPLRVYYQDLEEMKILSSHEFTVRWKNAYYGAVSSTLGLTPLPRHFYLSGKKKFDGKAFNDDHVRNRMIVGCGPYRLVKWEKDRRLVFERNPDYFGIALGAAPSIETLVFDVIKHPSTRFQALEGGSIDELGLTPEQWVCRADAPMFRKGRVVRYKYLLPSYTYIGYNQANPLFRDKRVRRALTLLVDREKLRRTVYFDLAQIVTGPFFPGSAYYDRGIAPLPFDPARARKLLAEAGWRDADGDGILEKDGMKFSFTMLQVATSTIQQRMMPVIKESFAAAGIDMKLQNVEWSVYVRRLEERRYDACCLGWMSGFDPDMYQVWHSSQRGEGGSNHINYANAELDSLIIELRKTFDMPRRIELARRIAAILHEDQPYTFLFCPYSLVALSSRYRNVRVFPSGLAEELFWVPVRDQLAVPGL